MNNITLSGRTVRVSKEVEYNREDGTKAKLTYVTLAVRGPRKDEAGDRLDDLFTLKFYDDLSEIAQKDLNLQSPKKLKAGLNNPIHSRTISIAGSLNIYKKEKNYEMEISYDLAEEKEFGLAESYILEKTVNFDLDIVVADITVRQLTFLDARPEFAKESKKKITTGIGKKIKAKIKSYNTQLNENKIDESMPV